MVHGIQRAMAQIQAARQRRRVPPPPPNTPKRSLQTLRKVRFVKGLEGAMKISVLICAMYTIHHVRKQQNTAVP